MTEEQSPTGNTTIGIGGAPQTDLDLNIIISFYGYFSYLGWTFTSLIALFGCIANYLNIVVFYKLGLNESVNISFFAIACADLFQCVFGGLCAICNQPDVRKLFMTHFSWEISDVGEELSHPFMTLGGIISSFITAYVALQRCLCVIIPLKVKTIFTAKRTILFVVILSLVSLAPRLPLFFIIRLIWIPYNGQLRNGSSNYSFMYYFGRSQVPNDFEDSVTHLMAMHHTILIAIANAFIVAGTVVLSIQLIMQSKWRKGFTESESSTGSASRKETKVVKTVLLICAMYVICSLPVVGFQVYYLMDAGFEGQVWTMYHLVWFKLFYIIIFIFQGINISANIFIYYGVSTQYQEMFNKLYSFHRCGRGTAQKPQDQQK